MAEKKKPAELKWVHALRQGGGVPLKDFHHCRQGWAIPPGSTFLVRGPNYIESKEKIQAEEPLLQPLAFDWLKSSSKISNIMKHPNCRVRTALAAAVAARKRQCSLDASPDYNYGNNQGSGLPFVWAFNLQLSNKENNSLVMYYVNFHSLPKGSLAQRFLDGDDAFRNSRLKLLTSIAQGPWIVKTAVGERGAGCLIGKVLTCTYIKEEHYMEVDVDVGSSIVAQAVTQLSFGAAAVLSVDVAFLVEGITPLELPEKVLGTTRFANLEISLSTSIDSPLLSQGKDKPKPCNRLWRSLSKLLHAGHRDPVASVKDDDDEDVNFYDAEEEEEEEGKENKGKEEEEEGKCP